MEQARRRRHILAPRVHGISSEHKDHGAGEDHGVVVALCIRSVGGKKRPNGKAWSKRAAAAHPHFHGGGQCKGEGAGKEEDRRATTRPRRSSLLRWQRGQGAGENETERRVFDLSFCGDASC